MALYTRGVPVSVIEHGVERTLTAAMLAADVLEQLGGVEELQGPPGPEGPQGPQGPPGVAGADAVARVAHGSIAGATRPTGYAMVIWIGSVEPTNRAAGDLWVRTT